MLSIPSVLCTSAGTNSEQAEHDTPAEDTSFQNFSQDVSQLNHSESLSSLDSLEEEEKDQISREQPETTSCILQENNTAHTSVRPQSPAKHFYNPCNKIGTTFFKKQFLNTWITGEDNENTTTSQGNSVASKNESSVTNESLSNKLYKAIGPNWTEPEMPDSHVLPNVVTAAHNYNSIQDKKDESYFYENDGYNSKTFTTENASQISFSRSPTFIPSKAWATPDPTPRAEDQMPGKNSGMNQEASATEFNSSKNPTATPVILPNQCDDPTRFYSDITSTSQLQKQISKSDISISSTSSKPLENADRAFSQKPNLVSLANDVKNPYSSITRTEVQSERNKNAEATSQMPLLFQLLYKPADSSSGVDQKGKMENGVKMSSLSNSNSQSSVQNKKNNTHKKNEITLLKSILKKESKYSDDHLRSVFGDVHFGKQTVTSVRDSVELAKLKGKDQEKSRVKKKLRWFDEVQIDSDKYEAKINIGETNKEVKSSEVKFDMQSKAPSLQIIDNLNGNNMKKLSTPVANSSAAGNQQGHSNITINTNAPVMSGIASASQIVNPGTYAGCHFTKQAWSTPKATGPSCGSGSEKTKTEVVRKVRSARARLGSAGRSRKGAIIRPQSAREPNRVATQGTITAPHPPPKPIVDKNLQLTENVANNGQTPINPLKLQSRASDLSLGTRGVSALDHVLNRDIPENSIWPQSGTFSSNFVTITPFPPPYTVSAYESVSKTTYMLNTDQKVGQQEGLTSSIKKGPVYGETGLRLDRTPTDEEISLLWQGVRTALSHKESGDAQHNDAHSKNHCITYMHPTRPNLSHVTIDGGSLLSDAKATSRLNGFFSPPSSVSAAARRKQMFDTKYKALLEQRRQIAGFAARKATLAGQNTMHTIQISPFTSSSEPAQTMSGTSTNKVSESTTQFLLAENLVETSAVEDEILGAMEITQAQKQAFLQHKAQRLGITALSIEEQRLLQSLEHLNQRLHYVQEAVGTNPSATSILQISSPFSTQPATVSKPGDNNIALQRYRSMSTDTRTRVQKRH
nr:PREDICTED: centrosomal protein of 126 kDa [Latimeria chalumnae]|eukprot:XP_006009485.1 PREDICTED: centrosomal protein of 126 kDa [Latimeria chalumnae]